MSNQTNPTEADVAARTLDQDATQAWLDGSTTASPCGKATAFDIYTSYKEWSLGKGLKPASAVILGRWLRERGYTKMKSVGECLWVGLSLIGQEGGGSVSGPHPA